MLRVQETRSWIPSRQSVRCRKKGCLTEGGELVAAWTQPPTMHRSTISTGKPTHAGPKKSPKGRESAAVASKAEPIATGIGRILSQDDSDDMAAYIRMKQARQVWGRFKTLLQADGASVDAMGRFYRAVIQQTLLFGAETWVLSKRALSRLERFHARCARGIAHRPIRRNADGSWHHPPTTEVLETCHLQPVSVYIQRRRHTLFEHYAESYCDLCRECLKITGPTPGSLCWWKLGMDLE